MGLRPPDAIRESHLNATRGHFLSDPIITEDLFTTDIGELFRYGQEEYGRCISSVYVDPTGGGPPRRVGWVFQKRREYQDDTETYLHEVWVELLYRKEGE